MYIVTLVGENVHGGFVNVGVIDSKDESTLSKVTALIENQYSIKVFEYKRYEFGVLSAVTSNPKVTVVIDIINKID